MIHLGRLRLDKEDREFLREAPEVPKTFYGVVSIPDEIGTQDIKNENQGQMGSCQGNAITSCVERCHMKTSRAGVQLSRIFAYLASQKLDNLLYSDQGSTISSGVKVALKGIPTEELVPYPNPMTYPSRAVIDKILSPANYEAGVDYAVKSVWQVPKDCDRIVEFIAGRGAINLGMSWYSGIIPKDRVIRNFRPPLRAGGHAVALLGYTRRGNFKLKLKNSHGFEEQEFEATPDAMLQILNHRWTAAIGVLGTTEPEPVDWVENSPLFLE